MLTRLALKEVRETIWIAATALAIYLFYVMMATGIGPLAGMSSGRDAMAPFVDQEMEWVWRWWGCACRPCWGCVVSASKIIDIASIEIIDGVVSLLHNPSTGGLFSVPLMQSSHQRLIPRHYSLGHVTPNLLGE